MPGKTHRWMTLWHPIHINAEYLGRARQTISFVPSKNTTRFD